jgi:hypothetical protein
MSIFLQHGMAGHKIGLAPQHIEASWRNVRFTPKSGHPSARVQRPLSQTRRIKSSQPVSITYCTAFAQFIMSPNNSAQRVNRWCVMTQYVVGLRHKTGSRALTIDAEDALIAALKAKQANPEATITYVRKSNRRGDSRHPHEGLSDKN